MSLPQPPTPTRTCYRHPDRDAGRKCTRCGRPACSDCLVQAQVGSHCLECAKATQPSPRARMQMWNARQPAMMTLALMIANVAVFVWVTLGDTDTLMSRDGISERQFRIGLTERFLSSEFALQLPSGLYVGNDEWYRLITSGFLHFGLIHIAFNMFLLYQLGQLIEPAIGRIRFALMYFTALLGGSAGALLLQPDNFHGGASGAVFGLMAAAAVGLHQRGVNPLQTSIGPLLLINLFITFTIPNISIGGHLGGIVAGGACAFVVLAPDQRRPQWVSYAFPVAISAATVAVSLMVVNS